MPIAWNKVTWYSKILALVLFVILPFAGFYFGIQYGAARQYVADYSVNLKQVSSQNGNPYYEDIAAWQTDPNHSGWSIAYPIDFDTNDNYSNTPSDDWRMGMPGGPGLQFFTLTIPRVFEPQTNFADAKLTVGMSGNAAAVAECLIAEPTEPNQPASGTTTINGTVFTVFHFADAGAGNYYETTSYRTRHVGACWAVEYTIHSSQIGNYPPEYQLKPFDETALHDVLDRIVGTFKFQ
jgi:hypothetical protein